MMTFGLVSDSAFVGLEPVALCCEEGFCGCSCSRSRAVVGKTEFDKLFLYVEVSAPVLDLILGFYVSVLSSGLCAFLYSTLARIGNGCFHIKD